MLKILFQADSQSVCRASFKLHSKLTPILTHKKEKKNKEAYKKHNDDSYRYAASRAPRS